MNELLENKDSLISGIESWASSQIDDIILKNPKLTMMGKYVKNGVHNYFIQKKVEVDKSIDTLSMFLCDENGTFNKEQFFEDLISNIASLNGEHFSFMGLKFSMSDKGIGITMPDNMLTNMLLGRTNGFTIGIEDIKQLKNFVK